VDGRPLETTDLAEPNAGRQFEQTFSRLTVEGSSSQILEGIAEQARGRQDHRTGDHVAMGELHEGY
jgi:hypothetical protein